MWVVGSIRVAGQTVALSRTVDNQAAHQTIHSTHLGEGLGLKHGSILEEPVWSILLSSFALLKSKGTCKVLVKHG